MVKVMLGHIWPAGEPKIKRRVALAGSLLIGAKVHHIVIKASLSHYSLEITYCPIDSKNIPLTVSLHVKVLNTSVPFFLSHAIDHLNSTGAAQLDPATSQAAATTAITAALVSFDQIDPLFKKNS